MAETISPEKQTVETCLKNRTYYIDFYHKNKDFDDFNNNLKTKCGNSFSPIQVFDSTALEQRNRLLYELVKIIWEV